MYFVCPGGQIWKLNLKQYNKVEDLLMTRYRMWSKIRVAYEGEYKAFGFDSNKDNLYIIESIQA